MVIIYGLKNCDTTRKARRWLKERDCEHRFVDVRSDGIDKETVRAWIAEVGWEKLLNRRSTTWRQLGATQRDRLNTDKAVSLIVEYPALIKRPVLQHGRTLLIGFDSEEYANLLD